MRKIVLCVCCWNPQVFFFTDTNVLDEKIVGIIGRSLKDMTHKSCSSELKASGTCYAGSAIVISESRNFLIKEGGRFGLGFLSHEVMERQGFQWSQRLYIPETWCSPTGKKIEGIYLM